jgi:protein-tyrosine phosphatase
MIPPPPGVLVVCLGNICRSPTAEYVLRDALRRRKVAIPVASRGLGDWHVGHGADRRAVEVARTAGIDLGPHRARQFQDEDFQHFAMVLAVDRATLAELRRRVPAALPPPERFLVAAGLAPAKSRDEGDIPDPYTGTLDDFRAVLGLVQRGAGALAERLSRDADVRNPDEVPQP